MRVVVGWHGDVAYDVAGPVIASPRKAASRTGNREISRFLSMGSFHRPSEGG
jgi:hypothetical protein